MKSSLTLCFVLACASSTSALTPAEQPAFAGEIAALEASLEEGLATRDRKRLEPLVANPFTWVHASDGRVDDREGWLANAARGMALTGQRAQRSEHGVMLVSHGAEPHTVVRVARVRLLDSAAQREMWIRQTHTLVRTGKTWQLAMGQGVIMYDGPPLDASLHARYEGEYRLEDGRRLLLYWIDGSLLATFPNNAQTQVFLRSPTEEAARNPSAGELHFTLDAAGAPQEASLRRGEKEIWRAARQKR